MDIRLHNTLSGKKEAFKPLAKGSVGMYHCGPTVYNYPQIGNLRSYVFADTLRRLFAYA
ncbi:MAG: cysteine--tRNA ligase, partial [Candidatus Paceibacterota bacterium]